MKKSSKLLVLAIILVLVLSQLGVSAQTLSNNIKFSNIPYADLQIIANDKVLTIVNFPLKETSSWLMFWLEDDAGNKYNNQVIKNSESIKYDMSSVRNGTYYLQIYTGPQQYSEYWSYIFQKDVPIQISGGTALFIMPPVYGHNVKVFNSRRTDVNALAYYLQPSKGIPTDNKEIIALADKITKNISDDYAKVKAVHDWVANNIYYDWDSLTKGIKYDDNTAEQTLKNKRAVCQGFANLTAALLRVLGIPVKVVDGYTIGSNSNYIWTEKILNNDVINHSWNEAFVNNRWIIIDVTWDTYNDYKNGIFIKGGDCYYRYFDITIEAISIDHRMQDYDENHIAAAPSARALATPTKATIILDGKRIELESYNIDNFNYFKLRDIAMVLNGTSKQFEVTWDGVKNTIFMNLNMAYTNDGGELSLGMNFSNKVGTLMQSAIYLDNKPRYFTAYNIDNYNFFKLRDLMRALNIYVEFDNETNTIILDTSREYYINKLS